MLHSNPYGRVPCAVRPLPFLLLYHSMNMEILAISGDISLFYGVLCAASAYERKFYLNPEFNSLPEEVKQELQIMCVLYTADVGGILMVVYDENGNLELKVDHKEDDFTFDEIGSVLKIKELQKTKEELFESLEMFYKVFYLGEDSDDI